MQKLTNHLTYTFTNAPKIVIEYSDLLAGKDLKTTIEQAYGPQGKSLHTKAWVSYLLTEFLNILKLERQLYLFSISLPISDLKNWRSTRCQRFITARAGRVEFNSFKVNMIPPREVTISTVRQMKHSQQLLRQISSLQVNKKNFLVLTDGYKIFPKCNLKNILDKKMWRIYHELWLILVLCLHFKLMLSLNRKSAHILRKDFITLSSMAKAM